jgi:hypothetical protein
MSHNIQSIHFLYSISLLAFSFVVALLSLFLSLSQYASKQATRSPTTAYLSVVNYTYAEYVYIYSQLKQGPSYTCMHTATVRTWSILMAVAAL